MVIKKLVLGLLQTNCYFVIKNDKCLVIDPASDCEKILNFAKENNAEIVAVLLTHGHFDHVGACGDLQKNGIKIYCGKLDGKILIENPKLLGLRKTMFFEPDVMLEDGDILNFDDIQVKCFLTSGHTEGAMSYLVENNLFCGDTIFAGGNYGRCDLFSGDIKKIKHSIFNVIFKLSDETKLFCGHGEESTIKIEKKLLTDF